MNASGSNAPPSVDESLVPSPRRRARSSIRPTLRTHSPILASDALREDVAPLEPAKKVLRTWYGALATIIALAGIVALLGIVDTGHVTGARLAFAAAAAIFGAVFLPIPYLARGIVIGVTGLTVLLAALFGMGPAGYLVAPPASAFGELPRILAATALPGVLLFRSRYRAYKGARIALIVGLVLAAPAVVQACFGLAADSLLAKITAGLVLLSLAASLIGFMGADTTGASTAWAVAVQMAIGIDVVARCAWMPGQWHDSIARLHAGLVFVATTTLVSLGIFQVLSAVLAPAARRVDVHPPDEPPDSEASTDEYTNV